jgi:hypothetical protein
MVALGLTFFEPNATAAITADIFIGAVAYAIGLAYLFAAHWPVNTDLFNPNMHLYIWSAIYGVTEGLGTVVYAPYMPNAIWIDEILNGTLFRLFVPGLIVVIMYTVVITWAIRSR